MQVDEIRTMCEKLASKYQNQQEFDDLVSVGVLKCLELVAEGVKSPPALYYRARDEMNDYFNLKSSPISYSKGRSGREQHKAEDNTYIDALDAEIQAIDTYGSFEIKNVMEVLSKDLTDYEKRVMLLLYNNDNDLNCVSQMLGVSRRAVSYTRESIRDKLVTICELP